MREHEDFASAARETAGQWRAELPAVAVVVLVHVLVPAALIVLVISLLDFLLAVRGVVIDGGTATFKWIVTCFVSASVLIVRHSRAEAGGTSVDARIYLLFLAFATTLSILWVSPQTGAALGNPQGRFGAALVNLGLVAIVWWLATALARQMCLEGIGVTGDAASNQAVHYGDSYREWLQRKEWSEDPEPRQRERSPQPREGTPLLGLVLAPFRAVFGEVSLDAHGNPSRGVARLVVLVLIGCAFAEPLILRGDPEAGWSALGALIAFLLSAGALLAIGSVAGVAHHAALAGGEMKLSTVAMRAAVGAAFTVVVLAVTLLLPGLRFAGDGEFVAEVRGRGSVQVNHRPEEVSNTDSNSTESGRQPQPGAGGLPGALVGLGRILVLPALVAAVLFGVWVLVRLRLDWGALLRGGWKGLLAGLRSLLSRLSRLGRGGGEPGRPRPPDPFARLESLAALAPHEAVLAAFGRWLDLVDLHGRPRPVGDTSLDVMRSLPRSLQGVAATAGRLTLIHQRVAYGRRPATERDRDEALQALRDLREALAKSAVA